jgi:uncharacterized membrane protein
VILIALRLFTLDSRKSLFWIAISLLAVFGALVWMTGDEKILRAYPVLISLALFVVFAGSLVYPPPIIERLVRMRGKPLPPEAIPYLRWVTIGWSWFFIVNALVAAWTAWLMPMAWWAVYNGLVSYLLIAFLFAVEYIIRKIYQRRVHGAFDNIEPGSHSEH